MSRRWILAAFVVLGAACSSSSDADVQQTASPVTTAAPDASPATTVATPAPDPRAVQVSEEMLATGMILTAEASCIEQTLTDHWANDPAASRRVNSDRTLAQQHVASAMGDCIDVRRFSYASYVAKGVADQTARCIAGRAVEADLRTVILIGAGADPATVIGTVADARPRLEAIAAGCS